MRMALTIGLIVWVFQSQAEMDRRVYRNYIDIRKYESASCLPSQHTVVLYIGRTCEYTCVCKLNTGHACTDNCAGIVLACASIACGT